jgi:hypothetical protein
MHQTIECLAAAADLAQKGCDRTLEQWKPLSDTIIAR